MMISEFFKSDILVRLVSCSSAFQILVLHEFGQYLLRSGRQPDSVSFSEYVDFVTEQFDKYEAVFGRFPDTYSDEKKGA